MSKVGHYYFGARKTLRRQFSLNGAFIFGSYRAMNVEKGRGRGYLFSNRKNLNNLCHFDLCMHQLVDFQGDEYTSKAIKDTEEARQLIENGFEYVCTTPDEIMLFRKRK